MSKDIDPEYITPEDLAYIRDREFLHREFVLQGFGDPLKQDDEGNYTYPYLVDKDGNYINGTPTDRGGDGDDDSGSSSPDPDALDDGGDTNVQAELPEDQRWSDQNTKAELHAVIDARNASREDEAWHITVDGDKKDNLLDALRADDQRIAEFRAENPDTSDE